MTAHVRVISRVLNSAGIRKSETSRGRVSSVSSEGFEVFTNYENQIIVRYCARSSALKAERERFIPKHEQAMAEIQAVLIGKGYEVTTSGNQFIVTKN
jgi:hypothetical protein